jgi:hypothetical protein
MIHEMLIHFFSTLYQNTDNATSKIEKYVDDIKENNLNKIVLNDLILF